MTDLDQVTDQFNGATDGTVAIDVEHLLVAGSREVVRALQLRTGRPYPS
jgi:hypothetical protein